MSGETSSVAELPISRVIVLTVTQWHSCRTMHYHLRRVACKVLTRLEGLLLTRNCSCEGFSLAAN